MIIIPVLDCSGDNFFPVLDFSGELMIILVLGCSGEMIGIPVPDYYVEIEH